MAVNGAEELEAGRWIKKQVEAELGKAISGAWLDVIPEGAKLPAVRFSVQSRNDIRTVSQHIVMTRLVFQVIASVEGEKAVPLVDLAKRINLALHRKSGVTSNSRILACTRIQPFGMTDSEQAHVYRMAGGIYELFVQSLE